MIAIESVALAWVTKQRVEKACRDLVGSQGEVVEVALNVELIIRKRERNEFILNEMASDQANPQVINYFCFGILFPSFAVKG